MHKTKDPITKQEKHNFQEIHSCFEKYYKNLYSQMTPGRDKSPEYLLASLNIPTITEDQNRVLMANVSVGKLQKAISRLKANKSPGPDGLTAEWYKTFSESLSPMLLRTFNGVLEKRESHRCDSKRRER